MKNSFGLVFLSFYIGVTRATLVPLECYGHVTKDLASIVALPQVLCGSSEHDQMQAVAVGAIVCLPLAFLAHSMVMTWLYPRRTQEGDLRFLESTKYLDPQGKETDAPPPEPPPPAEEAAAEGGG